MLGFMLLAWWGGSAGRMMLRETGGARLTVITTLGIAIATIGAVVNLVGASILATDNGFIFQLSLLSELTFLLFMVVVSIVMIRRPVPGAVEV